MSFRYSNPALADIVAQAKQGSKHVHWFPPKVPTLVGKMSEVMVGGSLAAAVFVIGYMLWNR